MDKVLKMFGVMILLLFILFMVFTITKQEFNYISYISGCIMTIIFKDFKEMV